MSDETIDFGLAGTELRAHRWLPQGAPTWTLVIVHGMGEHGARYARFAMALCAAGAAVYAPDLPGHGLNVAPDGQRGHFADREGWALAVSVIHQMREAARARHPGLPLFVFGHSMGSFLTQTYLVEHGAGLSGAVLSATSDSMGPLRAIGAILMRIESLVLGPRHRSRLAYALSFRQFNRRFAPVRTPSDWLSADPDEVDKHLADPLAAFVSSAGLWIDLLTAGAHLRDAKRIAQIPKQLPVLMIAGSDDPVSDGGKGARSLARLYRAAGLTDICLEIYPGGRHELLNDRCRDQVTADLLNWFADHRSMQPAPVALAAPAQAPQAPESPAADFA